jgi:uncharacterized membrane protein
MRIKRRIGNANGWTLLLGALSAGIVYGVIGYIRKNSKKEEKPPNASVQHEQGAKIENEILVAKTPEELFHFWRNVENLPRFMSGVEAVIPTGGNTSHWVVRSLAGLKFEWDAEVFYEVPMEIISWRTLPGSEINHAGSVHFEPLPGKNLTRVRLVMSYEPPAGKVGQAIGNVFGYGQAQRSLTRFRELMEYGEILTLEEPELTAHRS